MMRLHMCTRSPTPNPDSSTSDTNGRLAQQASSFSHECYAALMLSSPACHLLPVQRGSFTAYPLQWHTHFNM
eukprot:830177-Amphidinium_carterae.1